jgi:hypothetical protein
MQFFGNAASVLFREKLFHIAERLEFKRVAGGIIKEHGRLFAGLALETRIGRDLEFDICSLETRSEFIESVHIKHHAEMRHRHIMAVDGVVNFAVACAAGFKVDDNLMAEEIEIYPAVAAAAFGTAK